ncbi:hypothetical protein FA13DRAFT_1731959 [Coprinellus micaceus]|uniref:Uncharacterized protein n=1 Tax=Coprinellus micaceus TaxID=71717 RepID=A0A4Y7TDX0_COPMI|nr:hypothetical protein FA13DRAFT_1731959 [Coprinellus micaceus]
MATWRNGSAFGFDGSTALAIGTKRLQVRVLRWSFLLLSTTQTIIVTRSNMRTYAHHARPYILPRHYNPAPS